MSIFTYTPDELLGTVESVDTSMVIVKVENDDKLRGLQVKSFNINSKFTSRTTFNRVGV